MVEISTRATLYVEVNKRFRLVCDDVMKVGTGRQQRYTCGSLPGLHLLTKRQ
jgi:hypothetical protein